MTPEEIVAAAIRKLEQRRTEIGAQISVLHDCVRSISLSGGFALDPTDRAVVALARAILGAAQ